jgi:Cohesin domain/PEP-CTERM motif
VRIVKNLVPWSVARGVAAALFVLFLTVAARPAAAAPITLSVLPSLHTAAVGDTFQLDIAIANVADLFAYQFDLNFNPSILSALGVLDGGFLTSGGGTSVFGGAFALTLDNTTGVITILDSLLGPAPPATGAIGGGTLASITFTALASGSSAIEFANAIFEDSLGNSLDAQLTGGHVDVAGGSGEPSPVPEPGTLTLMASGLAIAAIRRRRKGGLIQ